MIPANSNSKKYVLFALICLTVCLIVGGIFVYVVQYSQKSSLDKEALDQYSCNRKTLDVRETDIYCTFPELTRGELPSVSKIREIKSCQGDDTDKLYEFCRNTALYRESLRKYLQ